LIRDVSSMGSEIGPRAVRITVEDATTNQAIVKVLSETLRVLRTEPLANTD
jgi:hypothetical protein